MLHSDKRVKFTHRMPLSDTASLRWAVYSRGDKSGLCGHAMKPYFHGAGGKNFNCRAPDVVQRFIGTATVIAASVLQTKIAVRKYNLLKQELTKKLYTNCRWVSSIAVHPRGIAHCIIAVF